MTLPPQGRKSHRTSGSGTGAAPPETAARRSGTGAALGLAALLGAAGLAHFVATDAYAGIIPRALPAPRAWVYASGAAELVCAGLVAGPRTRRLGGWLTAGLFIAVFPANVQMALDGGIAGGGLLGPPLIAWLRLPLQIPLIAWAVWVARH